MITAGINYEPKIKGIDYDYLKKLLFESIAMGEDQNTLSRRARIYFAAKFKNFLKTKINGGDFRRNRNL